MSGEHGWKHSQPLISEGGESKGKMVKIREVIGGLALGTKSEVHEDGNDERQTGNGEREGFAFSKMRNVQEERTLRKRKWL